MIEGDHGSTYFHPESETVHAAIACQVELQCRADGDAMSGRRLYPLLAAAGFKAARVSPRLIYVNYLPAGLASDGAGADPGDGSAA